MSNLPEIAVKPCPEPWDAMSGGARERTCARCSHSVYDVASRSEEELGELIGRARSGEKICVRLGRTAEGEPLVAKPRRPSFVGRVAAACALAVAGGLTQGCEDKQPDPLRTAITLAPPARPLPLASPAEATTAEIGSSQELDVDPDELRKLGEGQMLLGRLIVEPSPEERLEEALFDGLDDQLDAPAEER